MSVQKIILRNSRRRVWACQLRAKLFWGGVVFVGLVFVCVLSTLTAGAKERPEVHLLDHRGKYKLAWTGVFAAIIWIVDTFVTTPSL